MLLWKLSNIEFLQEFISNGCILLVRYFFFAHLVTNSSIQEHILLLTECVIQLLKSFLGQHHQPVRRRQDREDSRLESPLPQAWLEPSVLDDEGIRIRLRQFDSGASFRSSDLALHVGLQDSAQMHRTQEVPVQVFPGSLGEWNTRFKLILYNRQFIDLKQ